MPLFADHSRQRWVCGMALACALVTGALPSARAADQAVSAEQITQAAQALDRDPLMPGQHQDTTWRLRRDPNQKEKPPEDPTSLRNSPGLTGLAEWSRALMWLLGALLLGAFVMRMARLARMQADAAAARSALHPAEVGNLDIRPESLPTDISQAAAQLWHQGDALGALTLLYRGALSRLVHRHGVAIRSSSTEGDCLRLAGDVLDGERLAYVQSLTSAWMRMAYGHQPPSADLMQPLLSGFAARLDAPSVAAPLTEAAA